MSKGMPLDALVNRRYRGSNIDIGGQDNSVRVSVLKSGSDRQGVATPDGAATKTGDVMSYSSGLGPRAPSQNSKSREGNRPQMS